MQHNSTVFRYTAYLAVNLYLVGKLRRRSKIGKMTISFDYNIKVY